MCPEAVGSDGALGRLLALGCVSSGVRCPREHRRVERRHSQSLCSRSGQESDVPSHSGADGGKPDKTSRKGWMDTAQKSLATISDTLWVCVTERVLHRGELAAECLRVGSVGTRTMLDGSQGREIVHLIGVRSGQSALATPSWLQVSGDANKRPSGVVSKVRRAAGGAARWHRERISAVSLREGT
jgi:hypothetical protein